MRSSGSSDPRSAGPVTERSEGPPPPSGSTVTTGRRSSRSLTRPRPMSALTIAVTATTVMLTPVVPLAPANAVDATVYLRNPNGRCIEAPGSAVGTGLVLADCTQAQAQQVTIDQNGTVRMRGRCVGPAGRSSAGGARLTLQTCTSSNYYKWDSNGSARYMNRGSGRCIDNQWNVNIPGNPITQYDCNNTNAQHWEAVPVGTNPPGNPSGQPVPQGNLPGWRQIFWDDFTKAAPVGSWANPCSPDQIVYTGAQGQRWRTYPQCWVDTVPRNPYRPDQVLSVAGGVLNFHLHNVDGRPAGANPSPVIDGNSQYQTYGRYSARLKVDTPTLSEYSVAWLLWPASDNWPWDGEIDFPEAPLSGTAWGYHHYAREGACVNGCQESVNTQARFTDWHTYTIEWMPGRIRLLLDGTVVLNTTSWIPDTPMRWQLQTETNSTGNHNGNLLVDWVSVWAYSP